MGLEKPLVFLDTETTGTCSEKHRIIQCYAEIPQLEESIDIIMTPCDDNESFLLSPGALKTTGVDMLQILNEGLTQRDGAIALSRFIQKHIGGRATVVCHNSAFDKEHVLAWFERESMSFADNFYYHWRCTMQMAMHYQDVGYIESYSLKLLNLCEELGITLDNAHEASADVKATIAIYNKFLEWNKKPEKVSRHGNDYSLGIEIPF